MAYKARKYALFSKKGLTSIIPHANIPPDAKCNKIVTFVIKFKEKNILY